MFNYSKSQAQIVMQDNNLNYKIKILNKTVKQVIN